MFKYKMFKFKVVYLALAIIFILLVYKDVIEIICFFDTGAEDLSNAGGEYIKMQIIKTEMSLEIGLFNFFFYSSFVMPIVICLMGFDYSLIKKNYLIFSIGKNNKYDSYLKILKTIFAGI